MSAVSLSAASSEVPMALDDKEEEEEEGATVAASEKVDSTTTSSVARLQFPGVSVNLLNDDGSASPKFAGPCVVIAEYDPEGMLVRVCSRNGVTEQEFLVKQSIESARCGRRGMIFHLDVETILLKFDDEESTKKFTQMVSSIKSGTKSSVFNDRTEDSSAMQYFQFYGYLSQQQNMMQDYIRTSTYQKAILSNMTDFRDKVVLDVGAGSGILSFFAQQAGAKRVYAVEGSSIAKHAENLVRANKMNHIIKVISGKIEEIELPEKVDMIISEPMGYMLLNERMLETYLHAKKWLKPQGKMFPSRGDLHVAPFTDEALYMEQVNKVNFWYQDYFHGVNLSSLRDDAMKEYFRQPIVDTFDIRICLAKTERHVIDFYTTDETELHCITIPLEFHILQSGIVHGLAFWFDVAFIGTGATVWLSTAPTEPLTHWYQVRCLLEQPILVKEGQMLSGKVIMQANMKQSYDVTIECQVVGTSTKSRNSLDLKNPYFRYTGVQPQPPPGENHVSPSEMYWSQVDMQGARQAVNLVNGMIVDGLGHVSLDNGPAVVNGLGGQGGLPVLSGQHANIHQGSILATGRKDNGTGAAVANGMGATQQIAVVGATGSASAVVQQQQQQHSIPMSAANSLQFNQLIGGGVSPNLLGGCHTTMSMASATSQGLNLTQSSVSASGFGGNLSSPYSIGDYMHSTGGGGGGGGLVGHNVGASTAAGAPPAAAFKH